MKGRNQRQTEWQFIVIKRMIQFLPSDSDNRRQTVKPLSVFTGGLFADQSTAENYSLPSNISYLSLNLTQKWYFLITVCIVWTKMTLIQIKCTLCLFDDFSCCLLCTADLLAPCASLKLVRWWCCASRFHWTNWCQTSHGLSYRLINRELMVWVGVISPSMPHLFQHHACRSCQPSASLSVLVLTIIVVQIRRAACTEAGYSSTTHQRICLIDKHLVNI